MFSASTIIALAVHFRYVVLFPLLFFEGPITTVVLGFLVSLGGFSILGAFLLVLSTEILSDLFYYSLGRSGRIARLSRLRGILKLSDERLQTLETYFEHEGRRTLIISTVTFGLGTVGCVAAGVSRYSFRSFLTLMTILSIVKSSILLAVGYFYGQLYFRIAKDWEWAFFLVSAIIVLAWFIYLYLSRRRKSV